MLSETFEIHSSPVLKKSAHNVLPVAACGQNTLDTLHGLLDTLISDKHVKTKAGKKAGRAKKSGRPKNAPVRQDSKATMGHGSAMALNLSRALSGA